MRVRLPGAARALIVLTAAGLLLSGCHYGHRAYHGGPYYAAPGHHYHGGKHWKKRHGHHGPRHGRRGYY